MKEAGFIETRREGLFVYSCAVPGVIEAYSKALRKMVRSHPAKHSRRN